MSASVRRERGKTGFGLSLDQALSDNAAVFARASRNDGQSETYAFAEIERSLSAGATLQGAMWGRAGDAVGIAAVRNGLAQAHRDYLAAGGVGAFIGDGRLDYRPNGSPRRTTRLDWASTRPCRWTGSTSPTRPTTVRAGP